MNEHAARQITLVRAVEEADTDRVVLSDDDRLYASRSAVELARGEVAGTLSAFTPALFLQKRAQQLVLKLNERHPTLSHVTAPLPWLRWMAAGLPLVALLTGVLVDRVSNPSRVDLLSAPLLLILLWNGVVYFWLLGSWLLGRVRKSHHSPPRWLSHWRPNVKSLTLLPPPLAQAVAQFGAQWLRSSAPLIQATLARAVHLSSALFALGAIGSLVLRGLFTQYRAGWESTFFNAEQVHRLLTWLFTPAMTVFALPGFSLAEVQALRNTASASVDTGAQWVTLYGATLVLMVVLPRLALAAWAGFKERRLRRHFPLDVSEPYFRKLTANLEGAAPTRVHVFPYSFALNAAHHQGLTRIAQQQWGGHVDMDCQTSTAYGDTFIPPAKHATQPETSFTVALFNLSATPERENQGEFLDQLARSTTGPVALWVDESDYRDRVGALSDGARRMKERLALWQHFGDMHHLPVTLVRLLPAVIDSDAR